MRAYQSASTPLMTSERGKLESSNVASQFYSNDRLRTSPVDVMDLMRTNRKLLKVGGNERAAEGYLFSRCESC